MFVPFVLPRDSDRLEARLAPRLRPLDAELLASVLKRMHDVQKRGDSALLELTRTIDGVDLRASAVPLRLVDDAVAALPPALRRAIDHALENIVSVNEAFLPANREHAIRAGTLVGERFTPLASVGLWVPARKGPLVSSALMLAGAARAARVPRIAVATAPLPGGGFEPTTFAAARLAGASEFYVGNGLGMIAALCFGTASIAPVDGIFGPGPPAVLAAMGLAGAFGVRTALGIGPTDCMILADGSADPVAVALDLMTEAEHGPDSAAVLVTPSEALARAVCGALAARLPAVEPARRAVLEHSFGPAGLSALALVPDWRAACGLAQSFAPEHLMLVGDEAEALAGELSCAGEVLRGASTPFAAANYAIGVTAVLPTNGFARRFSGITAKDMLRMTTTASLDTTALEALASTVTALAGIEGLPCHAAALTARPQP